MAFLYVREAREHLVHRRDGAKLDVKQTFRFGVDYLDLTGEKMFFSRNGPDNFIYARMKHGRVDFKFGITALDQIDCENLIAGIVEAEGTEITGEENFSNKVCIQNVRYLKPGTPFGFEIHGEFIVYGLVSDWLDFSEATGKGTAIITMLPNSGNWMITVN